MLTLFPSVLFLSPVIGTLLRMTVALAFFYISYAHVQRRHELGNTGFMFFGKTGSAFIVSIAFIEALLAFFLFVGYATQAFALVALALSIKHMIFAKKYPRAIPLCRGEYILISVMCICLFIMGAGAFAIDLPL